MAIYTFDTRELAYDANMEQARNAEAEGDHVAAREFRECAEDYRSGRNDDVLRCPPRS